ncbi:MAG: putative toxin-antitoxin system toxin component, PIN family [Leptospiraceae bacterium]|nr:putative toxin-antitoxin system toxin component, PIN family [Leptospiraceae bacterium]
MNIVIDTNVIWSGLYSSKGNSFRLLSLLSAEKRILTIHISVPLILEYEDVLKREDSGLELSNSDVDDFLDYICKIAEKHDIFYLWRPFLPDPKDDHILELAFNSKSNYIVTYNTKDFKEISKLGIKAVRPDEFIYILGAKK